MLTTIYNSLCKYPRSQESFTPPQVVFLRDFLPCMESKMAWDSTLRRDTENWCLARRFWHGEVGFLFFWKESCFSPKQQKHFYISTFLMDPQDHKIHRFHRTWILHPMRGSKFQVCSHAEKNGAKRNTLLYRTNLYFYLEIWCITMWKADPMPWNVQKSSPTMHVYILSVYCIQENV